jgi:hypothetical protein
MKTDHPSHPFLSVGNVHQTADLFIFRINRKPTLLKSITSIQRAQLPSSPAPPLTVGFAPRCGASFLAKD